MSMAMLCTPLIDRGLLDEAFRVGLAAVRAAPDDMQVRDLVSATLSRGVPKWHRPMLHDNRRNRAYVAALTQFVQPGMLVLEIGSGAGLLSLIAAKLGAEVYTCEANPIVAASARSIVESNGLTDKIRVISKLSTQLEIGKDLPRRADLLMSELFDDTLFGDGIVTFLADAHERLLVENATIVPEVAELRLALVDFDLPEKNRPLSMVEGFDLSPFNILVPRSSSILRVSKLDAERRSPTVTALRKTFTDQPPFGEDHELIKFRSSGGQVAGIAQWLRISFSNEIFFENEPFGHEESHWGSPITEATELFNTATGQEVPFIARRIGREIFFSKI